MSLAAQRPPDVINRPVRSGRVAELFFRSKQRPQFLTGDVVRALLSLTTPRNAPPLLRNRYGACTPSTVRFRFTPRNGPGVRRPTKILTPFFASARISYRWNDRFVSTKNELGALESNKMRRGHTFCVSFI